MKKLEMEFTADLLEILSKAEELTGTAEPRLAEQARNHGGAEAVKEMLRRGRTTRQFDALSKLRRLDLTPEALVTKGRYGDLFTDAEVDACLSALLEAGAYAW